MPNPADAFRLLRARTAAGFRIAVRGTSAPALWLASQSVRQIPLRYDLGTFSRALWGREFDGTKAGAWTTDLVKNNPELYRKNLRDALAPVVQAAYSAARQNHGDLTSLDSQRSCYIANFERPEGGHMVLAVTFVPHPDPSRFLNNPNALRFCIAGFPGSGAQLTGATALALTRARILEGTFQNRLAVLRGEIQNHNQQQFERGAPVLNAPWLLGSNSLIQTVHSVLDPIPGGGLFSASTNQTPLVHSQDGYVPWTLIAHPDYGNLLCGASAHFGNNPLPGGNEINAKLGGPLFNIMWRTAALMEDGFPELVREVGRDKAALLMLDRDFRSRFLSRLQAADWALHRDWHRLRALDATLGTVATALRIFWGGDTIATLDDAPLQEVQNTDEYARLQDAGVRQTESDGYAGPPSVEALDPSAVIIPPGDVGSGNVAAKENPDTSPYLPDARPHAEALERAARDLLVDPLKDQIDRAIRSRVQEAFDRITDPTKQSVADLTAAIQTIDFRTALADEVEALVLSTLSTTDDFAKASQSLGDPRAVADLIGSAVTDPLRARMTAVQDGSSYLGARLTSALTEALGHALSEDAGEIQRRIADATGSRDETSGERIAKAQALRDVEAALAAMPGDPMLQQRRQDLARELGTLERREREAEAEAEAAERDREATERRSSDAAERGREAGGYAEAHGREVFRGREAVAA